MKTRSRKAAAGKKSEATTTSAKVQQLDASVTDPPQVFIWPKDTSPAARVVTLPSPATSTPSRYLLCPERGCFEFTRVAAPKLSCHSWLLASGHGHHGQGETSQETGYVLQTPDLMVATPVDPLFLILPVLAVEATDQRMFRTPLDYLEKLEEQGGHLKQMLRQDESGGLEKKLEKSMLSVCDTIEAGNERLCRFSAERLLNVLVVKARRMVQRGLPASMEERFVKQALAVPVSTIRREASTVSLADGASTSAGAESQSTTTSQETQSSDASTMSTSTAATSIASASLPSRSQATPEVINLLRMRTALDFLLVSYVSASLRADLKNLLASPNSSPLDFSPLDDHLKHLAQLKQEAAALRSLSDNISRKRGAAEDDEAAEKAEAKKRKKEEDEARKKNVSQGVKKLAKADRTGMKSISSFFGAKPAGGKK